MINKLIVHPHQQSVRTNNMPAKVQKPPRLASILIVILVSICVLSFPFVYPGMDRVIEIYTLLLAFTFMYFAWARFRSHISSLTITNKTLNTQVAEQARQIAQLQTAFKDQKQLVEFKSRVAMMTSHEFRTPLSIILNTSYILQASNVELAEEQKQRYFETMHQQIDRLNALLDDLMALSEAETVTTRYLPDTLNIEQWCREMVAVFQTAHSATHTINFQSNGLFTEASIDRKLVHQVVTNLLSNAVKYSPSGGTILVDLSCHEDQFVMVVQDQGVGIPEEDLAHLFDLFYRGNNANVAPGTGLGLVIVKQAVERHGGTIHVASEVGRGTTFTICLPRLTDSRVEARDGQSAKSD